MKKKELTSLGISGARALEAARRCWDTGLREGMKKSRVRTMLRDVVRDPEAFLGHDIAGGLAEVLARPAERRKADEPSGSGARHAGDTVALPDRRAPYRIFGDDIDPKALEQMENAVSLPISVAGALLPDAHVGYGLPIGGVLATKGAVIPYAVGMDIACRMRLTVVDLPLSALSEKKERLIRAIEEETVFGVGGKFRVPRSHPVMEEDWEISPVTTRHFEKAREQLGTSGSGNHFVEFGELRLQESLLGLEAGTYLAFLSHSGSRGVGGEVAGYYSRLAMKRHPELPRWLQHLAWFELASAEGREYWLTMELMGRYSAANHELIHRSVLRNLGVKALAFVENHHNFAWREEHFGREVIVHRKGATPAGKGVLGVIPGSMAAPGFIVRGRGNPLSLHSASHGAGRCMGRNEAKKKLNWADTRKRLDALGITLIAAGLDESPFAYKDIEAVIAAQSELIDVVARFDPKIVRMAD